MEFFEGPSHLHARRGREVVVRAGREKHPHPGQVYEARDVFRDRLGGR
jgi:hypothetical protein